MQQTTLKRLLASATALVAGASMFALGPVSASAVENQPKVDLTLEGDHIAGHSYDAIKLADYINATYDETVTPHKLQSVAVTTVDDAGIKSAAIAAADTVEPDAAGSTEKHDAHSSDPMAYVAENWLDSQDAPAYNGSLRKFVTNLDVTSPVAASVTAETGTVKFNIPNGIYLILDKTGPQADRHDARSVPILVSTKVGADASDPTNKPGGLIDGAVEKVDVKTPNPDTPKKTTEHPSYNVGDTVKFTIKTSVPTYTGYKKDGYTLEVHDNPSEGLTYDEAIFNDPVVTVGDATLRKGTDYTVDTPVNRKTGPFELNFKLSPYIQSKIEAGDFNEAGKKITITYKLVLNGDAVKMTQTSPVHNEATLKYTNSPSGSTDGNPTDNTEPGKTPVYTFNFDLKKISKTDDTVVPGAEFTVAQDSENPISFVQVTAAGDIDTDNKSGIYRPAMTGETGTDTLVVPVSGTIKLEGLKEGTYTVKESRPADGFRDLNLSFKAIITATYKTDRTLDGVQYTGGTSLTGLVSHDDGTNLYIVANIRSLTQLPLTGAAGITMMVALGAVLVLAGSGLYLGVRRSQRSRTDGNATVSL